MIEGEWSSTDISNQLCTFSKLVCWSLSRVYYFQVRLEPTMVRPLLEHQSEGGRSTVLNTLAYYGTESIETVKKFYSTGPWR